MRTAHLFAGAGGGLLADLILGHTPVLAVEQEESCCNSLRDRAAEGCFPRLHIHCGDVREFDFTPWRGRVDCLSAGFPCQDISCAGKGAGIEEGARSGLVTEIYRAIDAISPPSSSSKTAPRSGPEDGTLSSRSLWRGDIPGATDSCLRLMLEPPTSGTDGGSLLPTLTVCGNWNRKGASTNSGNGIATALNLLPTLTASEASGGKTVPPGTTLSGMTPDGKKVQVGIKTALKMLPTLTRSMATWADFVQAKYHSSKRPDYQAAKKMLPTLCARDFKNSGGVELTKRGKSRLPSAMKHMLPTICATDYKSPYSAEGYEKQMQQRSKPLWDTLVHTTGHRLTAAFAEWWMGWPLRWTATRRAKESKRPATGKFPSRPPQRG